MASVPPTIWFSGFVLLLVSFPGPGKRLLPEFFYLNKVPSCWLSGKALASSPNRSFSERLTIYAI